ncbi:hypothetical protein C8R44DRAFT_928985 [Mycena epipterygia]|nr:hypothetical protein C8R44DRAFT_928985 [Mycena epipterygia]
MQMVFQAPYQSTDESDTSDIVDPGTDVDSSDEVPVSARTKPWLSCPPMYRNHKVENVDFSFRLNSSSPIIYSCEGYSHLWEWAPPTDSVICLHVFIDEACQPKSDVQTPSEFLGGIGSGPLNLGDKVYIKDFPSYKKDKIIEKEVKNSFGQNIEACVENNFVSESLDAEAGSGQKLGAERVTITAPYMTTIPDYSHQNPIAAQSHHLGRGGGVPEISEKKVMQWVSDVDELAMAVHAKQKKLHRNKTSGHPRKRGEWKEKGLPSLQAHRLKIPLAAALPAWLEDHPEFDAPSYIRREDDARPRWRRMISLGHRCATNYSTILGMSSVNISWTIEDDTPAGTCGGGFNTGSGAGAGAALGRTGGNFGTSGMDRNSGPGNSGGGFDTGSGVAGVGAGTGGYGAGNTTSSSNEYGSGNQYSTGSSSNEYGDTSNNSGGKTKRGR